MINVGLIGQTANFEPFISTIREKKGLHIIGKSTTDSQNTSNSCYYSIAEINRMELIEMADILLLDNSIPGLSMIMQEINKKSKPVFCTQHPAISIEECAQLAKLSNESGAVIQVRNPCFYHPAIQWMNKNVKTPAFIEYSNFENETTDKSLYAMLLTLSGVTGNNPKKTGAVTFSGTKGSTFSNVNLEFNDRSVISMSYGTQELLNDFTIRIYAEEQFATLNFTQNTFICNNKTIDLKAYSTTNEFNHFLATIAHKTKATSCIEDYLTAMHLARRINQKLALFSD